MVHNQNYCQNVEDTKKNKNKKNLMKRQKLIRHNFKSVFLFFFWSHIKKKYINLKPSESLV